MLILIVILIESSDRNTLKISFLGERKRKDESQEGEKRGKKDNFLGIITSTIFDINEMISLLDVQRRRICDVINVFEGTC